ncbi:glutaredoxin-1-like [Eublepharis macularius]|uniref:Glutaredoxin-1-like n=1 Tax=Eublepharis macularius TaxID=481883 RepID=A0AA97KPA5_EUBMA|nr:glutaredoxin-1-like [Eublepharis macularius]
MPEQFVSGKIQRNKVTAFGKSSRLYCHIAVELLEVLSVENLEYVDLPTRMDMSNIQNYMECTTGSRSVPNLFIGETCISGYDNLNALNDSGELVPRLKRIGAL